MNASNLRRFLCLAVSLTAIAACQQTTQPAGGGAERPVAQAAARAAPPDPQDERDYRLSGEFYRDPPDCATVLPTAGEGDPALVRAIEESAHRNLVTRLDRVIGPLERNALVRKLAVDLTNRSDRRVYMHAVGCRFFLQPTVKGNDDTYLVVWAHKSLDILAELKRGSDDAVLWEARRWTSRGDGGLPLFPISAGIAAIKAGMISNNRELAPSMIDDLFRVLFTSLPDLRQFSSAAPSTVRGGGASAEPPRYALNQGQ